MPIISSLFIDKLLVFQRITSRANYYELYGLNVSAKDWGYRLTRQPCQFNRNASHSSNEKNERIKDLVENRPNGSFRLHH
mmetsp:Transcript_32650/g.47665  ORF Transcript_32650/g.47665 Transcript_32650/m.47665 type:complete len:80 (-) Transcript_32650:989-1228(-)